MRPMCTHMCAHGLSVRVCARAWVCKLKSPHMWSPHALLGGLKAQRHGGTEDKEAPAIRPQLSGQRSEPGPQRPPLPAAARPWGWPHSPCPHHTVNSENSCQPLGLAPPLAPSRAVLAAAFLSWGLGQGPEAVQARNCPPPSPGSGTEGRGLCTASGAFVCVSGPQFPLLTSQGAHSVRQVGRARCAPGAVITHALLPAPLALASAPALRCSPAQKAPAPPPSSNPGIFSLGS